MSNHKWGVTVCANWDGRWDARVTCPGADNPPYGYQYVWLADQQKWQQVCGGWDSSGIYDTEAECMANFPTKPPPGQDGEPLRENFWKQGPIAKP